MSSETLSLPTPGGISLASLPTGNAPGDIFQYDGSQWAVVPNDNNNPLVLDGIVPPGAPTADSGVLYKQAGSDGLWWRTDNVAALDITLAAAATTDVPQGLNVIMVNPSIPAAGDNYHTIQAAVDAAASASTGSKTVLLSAGIFTENVTISGANIKLIGVSPQGSIGSLEGSRISGTVTINAPNVELNSLIVRKAIGLDMPSVVLGAGVAPSSGQVTYIWNCFIGKEATDSDFVTPTIDCSAVVGFAHILQITRSVISGTLDTSGGFNGGVNMALGTHVTLNASYSDFFIGRITLNTVNDGPNQLVHCRTGCSWVVDNQNVGGLQVLQAINCDLVNNVRDTTSQMFTISSSGGGSLSFELHSCSLYQIAGAAWINTGVTATITFANVSFRSGSITAPSSTSGSLTMTALTQLS